MSKSATDAPARGQRPRVLAAEPAQPAGDDGDLAVEAKQAVVVVGEVKGRLPPCRLQEADKHPAVDDSAMETRV